MKLAAELLISNQTMSRRWVDLEPPSLTDVKSSVGMLSLGCCGHSVLGAPFPTMVILARSLAVCYLESKNAQSVSSTYLPWFRRYPKSLRHCVPERTRDKGLPENSQRRSRLYYYWRACSSTMRANFWEASRLRISLHSHWSLFLRTPGFLHLPRRHLAGLSKLRGKILYLLPCPVERCSSNSLEFQSGRHSKIYLLPSGNTCDERWH